MKLSRVEVLLKEELERIHEVLAELLKGTGILIHSEKGVRQHLWHPFCQV